jgi:hypothetical protein
VTKFVAYLTLLASIAVGVAWYSLRAGIVPSSVTPNRRAVAEDTSWLSDLYSQNPRDTEKGTGTVEKLGVRALPRIQATLQDSHADRNHRRAALRACAILGVRAEPAIPEVAAALAEHDLAADAAIALSFMGRGALPPLQQALSNDDPMIRREALRSIGKLRFRAPLESNDVMPLVLDGMTDPDTSVRAVAATYLGIMHEEPEESVPLLAQGLQDPDPAVKRASATALAAFGAEASKALPALKKASTDQDADLAREAGRAIVAITGDK